ncbi:hypothetical protein RZS08_28995, partial [Arthrospira platensis SPKY1]|nr:hypothetical protein [Arthrospira platensis SPKY1]
MERKILLLGLLFSLFFITQMQAQPSCGGNTPGGPTPATFTDTEVGSSFTATGTCLGVLDEIEIKAGPGGGSMPAELRIYEGLIGSGGTLIFTQSFSLTPGDNMIGLSPSPGNPIPCLSQGEAYTFT